MDQALTIMDLMAGMVIDTDNNKNSRITDKYLIETSEYQASL